jgi:lysozyme
METSQNGIDLIKRFEGFRAKPYRCPAGVPTIGYGHTSGVSMNDRPITEAEAEELLRDDLGTYEGYVNKFVTVPVTQGMFDALVSFVYNVGPGRRVGGGFRNSTLLRLLNEGKLIEAAAEFLKWNKANGKELAGLTKRREAERNLFLSGLPGGAA